LGDSVSGTTRDGPRPSRSGWGWGVPSVGGPIVNPRRAWAFIAGDDRQFHSVPSTWPTALKSGRKGLPAGGQANPMTYRLKQDGKQFVVIAAGGHAMPGGPKLGDSLIAYTLGD